jgi:hypothetical protein
MKRYWIVAGVLAVVSGALFRGAAVTGNPFFEMGATIGLVLVGATAIGGVVRWQSSQGHKEVESALLSLGDSFIITDWASAKGPVPEYLLVAPAGIVCVLTDDMADGLPDTRAQQRLAAAAQRCRTAVQWVQEHAGLEPDIPVQSVLVLTRRKADNVAAEGISVLNPEHLAGHLKRYETPVRLDRAAQIKLTRKLRAAHAT